MYEIFKNEMGELTIVYPNDPTPEENSGWVYGNVFFYSEEAAQAFIQGVSYGRKGVSNLLDEIYQSADNGDMVRTLTQKI